MLLVGTYTRKLPHVHGKGKGIHVFSVEQGNGSIKFVPVYHAEEDICGHSPSWITNHGKLIFASNESAFDNGLITLAEITSIDPFQLKKVDQIDSKGGAPCHIIVSPYTSHIFCSNYHGGSVISLAFDSSSLRETQFIQFDPSLGSLASERNDKPHCHLIEILDVPNDPEYARAFICDLGQDKILQYFLHKNSGTILDSFTHNEKTVSAQSPVEFQPGSGPRHLLIHPSKSIAYSNAELSSHINTIRIKENGFLESVPIQQISTRSETDAASHRGNGNAAIRLHPNGNFLYVSNRGDDNIACFKVHEDGTLDKHPHFTPCGGQCPRDFAFVHDRYLVVGNQNSDKVSVFEVDDKTGHLKRLQESDFECPTPVSFLFLSDLSNAL